MASWLTPAGVTVGPDRVSGTFPVPGDVPGGGLLAQLRVDRGHVLLLDGNARAYPHVPAGEREGAAVFVARPFGRGRMAVLAAGTPLTAEAIAKPGGGMFANALADWLAGGEAARADVDGDFLSNRVEDRDGDRLANPGETDYRARDSDRDGLPDGVEDADGDGALDPGETAALDPDSDDDGVNDPADATPLGPSGAIRLGYVSPGGGPGEGGTAVRIEGLNLPDSAEVWFGERPALAVEWVSPRALAVVAPPHAGGVVHLRVKGPGGLESLLPGAFAYGPVSRATLTWTDPDRGVTPWATPRIREAGDLVLRIESGGAWDTARGRIVAVPAGVVAFDSPTLAPGLSGDLRVEASGSGEAPAPADDHAVVFDVHGPGRESARPAVQLSWRRTGPLPPLGRVSVRIKDAEVLASTGVPLRVEAQRITLFVR
jgi:hypothetical protein